MLQNKCRRVKLFFLDLYWSLVTGTKIELPRPPMEWVTVNVGVQVGKSSPNKAYGPWLTEFVGTKNLDWRFTSGYNGTAVILLLRRGKEHYAPLILLKWST